MAMPSPSYTVTLQVNVPLHPRATQHLVEAVADAGGLVTGIDTVESQENQLTVNLTCDCVNSAHVQAVRDHIEMLVGANVEEVSDATLQAHAGGKISVDLKNPLRTRQDLARIYTPGVARVCKKIARDRSFARQYTIKRNTVAVVTDGTAVLGLGDIGPEAALPVMEGKAALFKRFGNVDAWPVCLDTKDTEEIISIVKAIAPVYGGINLEDIAAPRCFDVEERLREELDIPVFHDDQHGTAVVTCAALINACALTGRDLDGIRVVFNGAGAAGISIAKLMLRLGVEDIVICDRKGAIHAGRSGLNSEKEAIAEVTNLSKRAGSLADMLEGADAFIGVSAPGVVTQDMVRSMNDDPIVFAMANPIPEILPAEARAAGAAVAATGRSDFPNQINNVLAFPGIFRGALDVRASDINDDMMVAATYAIADLVDDAARSADYVIPGAFDERVAPAVARAVAQAARESGVARL